MDPVGNIEIKIDGSVGTQKLTPAMVDIDDIRKILAEASNLLFPTERRSDRPLVSYEIAEGSVCHRFTTLTQAVIGFGAVLTQISGSKEIDFLHERSARAIEMLQQTAIEKDYVVTISANGEALRIDQTTNYFRNETLWVDAEFYLYGELTDAGGKRNANLHLDTEDHGVLSIKIDKDYLKNEKSNLLYRKFGIRVTGKQNLLTFEMDKSSLVFLKLFEIEQDYSETYLDKLIERAAPAWESITSPETWLDELRGGASA